MDWALFLNPVIGTYFLLCNLLGNNSVAKACFEAGMDVCRHFLHTVLPGSRVHLPVRVVEADISFFCQNYSQPWAFLYHYRHIFLCLFSIIFPLLSWSFSIEAQNIIVQILRVVEMYKVMNNSLWHFIFYAPTHLLLWPFTPLIVIIYFWRLQ